MSYKSTKEVKLNIVEARKLKYLDNDIRSYSMVVIIGSIAGAICALLDIFPNDNIWVFSSFSGSIGFWAITGTIVLMQSSKVWVAAINTFIYFAFMNTMFFFVYLLLPIGYPRVGNVSEAIMESLGWLKPSAICGLCAIVVYRAKKDNLLGTIALSLPLGAISYEAITRGATVIINRKYLFQTIIDIVGIILLVILYRGTKKPYVLVGCIMMIACMLLAYHLTICGTVLVF